MPNFQWEYLVFYSSLLIAQIFTFWIKQAWVFAHEFLTGFWDVRYAEVGKSVVEHLSPIHDSGLIRNSACNITCSSGLSD